MLVISWHDVVRGSRTASGGCLNSLRLYCHLEIFCNKLNIEIEDLVNFSLHKIAAHTLDTCHLVSQRVKRDLRSVTVNFLHKISFSLFIIVIKVGNVEVKLVFVETASLEKHVDQLFMIGLKGLLLD